MRAILVLVVVVVAGISASLLFGPDDDIAPPGNDAGTGEQRQASKPDPAMAERHNATPTPQPDQADKPSQPKAGPSQPAKAPPVDVSLVLDVRNVVTGAPIETFRWRFVRRADILRGESTASVARLALPRGSVGDLLVEADDMQPFAQRALTTPTANQPATHLDVLLTPAESARGITLMVKDLDRQPIQHVRVDAFKLNAVNKDSGWDLGQPIWTRQADAEDGTYELPPLPPGDYGIVLVATDTDGNLRPLSAYRQTFALSGNNGFLEDVPLEPACALTLDLFDGNGAPFDPTAHGDTSISLNQVGQVGIQRKWTAKGESGGTVSQANALTGTGRAWLDQPIAPGSYLLEILVNGSPRVSQTLMLRAEQQTETVYIR